MTRYSFYYRKPEGFYAENEPYFQISGVESPYLLDGLQPGTFYEVFVAAENKFGSSEGSERLIFSTQAVEEEPSNSTSGYSESDCCMEAKLNEECMPLCSYKVKLNDLQKLGPKCMHQLDILMRCGAGGRDHSPCCQRYSVNPACISMCSGKLSANQYDSFNPRLCTREMGAILTVRNVEMNSLATITA